MVTTNKLAQHALNKVIRMEKRARKLENDLQRTKQVWGLYVDTLRKVYPQTWKDYCNEKSIVHDYKFEDVLC